MTFKVGDKVRRKEKYQSTWWSDKVRSYGAQVDSIFTIDRITSDGGMVWIKEMSDCGAFNTYRFELVPTVNKRFAKELEE